MKLIDLLVQELPNRGGWPEGCYAITQDSSTAINIYDSSDGLEINEHGFWCYLNSWLGYCITEKESPLLASDYSTAIITRDQYESALAASEGWIDWHGGDFPVDRDAIVEIKNRRPIPFHFNNDRAGDFDWAHTGSSSDIIAYRLHKPEAKSRANDDRLEQDLNECIGQEVDVPEWNGDGLPPVGTICMANLANGWTDVKVAYIGDEGGLREALVFEIKTTKPAWADEFRPLRTEAEKLRDEAGLALYHAINWNAEGEMVSPSRMEDYKKAYDAIAAGKIPGVKLEGK